MTEKQSSKVSEKIESLCKQGCSDVNQLLQNVENGDLEDLAEFSKPEIEQIIAELSKIMAVYVKNDNCDEVE